MLTEEQKKRLAALHIKDAAALTEQEQKELAALTTMAEVDGLSIDDAFMAQYGPTEDRPLTGDELKKHISDAVTEGLKHYSGNMDVSRLAEEITKSLNIPDTGKGIAPEDLKSAVASALSAEAIIESLQSKLPTVPGEDQIKKLVEEVVNANLRNQSKNFYPVDEDINVPLSGHKGNLSVAEYQLLNICKMTGKVIDAKNIPTDINDGIPESIRKSAEQAGARFVQSLRMGRKDVFTTDDGHIFPSDLSSTLLYRLYLESQLAAALISQEIPMPTDPYTLPIATTRIKYRKGSEAPTTTTTADKIGLSDVTLKTAKLIGITDFSYEAAEDSIIPVLPMLMDDLAKGAVESLENAIINGDTAPTHQDGDITAADDAARLFDGLRKFALAQASCKVDMATGGISAASILKMKASMGKYGLRPSDLLLVVSASGYNTMLGLDETLTVDKAGPGVARILTGVVPSIYNIPIIVSEAIKATNTSGVVDATDADNIKDSLLLLYKPSLILGSRRGFTVESEVDKKRQVNSLIASFRRDFKLKEPLSSAPTVILGYGAPIL